MIVGTAGHIDHGKTALVRALTGVDTDRLKEEKERGISIDLGFAYMPGEDGGTLGFVDVPGHEKFLRNMLAGATGVDFVLLVVAADDGVMPQTREHLAIVDLLGVKVGLVALTKADLATPARRAEATREIREALAGTALAGAEILPVSATTGEGVADLRAKLLSAARGVRDAEPTGRFRLAVDRCFTLPGTGTIVTGTVLSGAVVTGDAVMISPAGVAARVRSIHAQNRPARRGVAGERCALNLAGEHVSKAAIARGDMVVDPALHAPASRIDATLRVLASEAKPPGQWMPARLHHAASETAVRVALLDDAPIRPGDSGRAQLVLEKPIAAAVGDRFVLRDTTGARTIGGGMLLDLRAPSRKRRAPARRAQLDALARGSPARTLAASLDVWPFYVDFAAFSRDRALTQAEADALSAGDGIARASSDSHDFVFSAATWAGLRASLRDALAAFHAANPEAPGLGAAPLRLAVEPRLPAPVFACVSRALVDARDIVLAGGHYRLPEHLPGLGARDGALWSRIAPLLSDAERFRPPRGKEIVEKLALPETDVRRVLKAMARQRELIEMAPDHFFLRDTAAEMADIAADVAGAAADGHFTAAQFRDRLDNGRKVAIQILEYFDRQGVTARRGDLRRINAAKRHVFRR